MLGNQMQPLASKSYDDVRHWEVFLQTLFNDEQIKVIGLQPETVEIECVTEDAKRKIALLLASPETLKANVIHSVFDTGSSTASISTYGGECTSTIPEDISPEELIKKALYTDFLESINLNLSKFEFDSSRKVWMMNQVFPNKQRKAVAVANFNLLQSALSNPDLSKILRSDGSEKIKSELPEAFVSQDIKRLFKIEKEELSLMITVDIHAYNAYLQIKSLLSFQAYESDQPSQDTKVVFDKIALIKYFNEMFQSGTIYKQEEGEIIRPIVALSSKMHENRFRATKVPNIIILMDVSGSMRDFFDEYKKNIISMINDIRSKYQESIIRIHAFASTVDQYGITIPSVKDCECSVSEQQQYAESLRVFDRYVASGGTALYYAIGTALSKVMINSNDIILLFTDGRQCSLRKSDIDVLQDIREKRERNQQFSMFAFGAGSYDKSFFERLSKTAGVVIEDLGVNFNELSLLKHMDKLGKSKTVVEFLSSTGILASLQVVPDQPLVSRHGIGASELFSIGMYSQLGREERQASLGGI